MGAHSFPSLTLSWHGFSPKLLLSTGSVAPGPMETCRGEGTRQAEMPAQPPRGGAGSSIGCQRRTPAPHGALCSKAPFGRSLFPLEDETGRHPEECCPPAKRPPPPAPLSPHNRPRPGPGHPQAECPPNWLRAHLLGPCRGAATLPPGVLGHPAGCPAPGGPAWLRGEDFPLPPSPRLQPTPPATAGMQAKGSCHPAATCHPVPPLCPVPRPRR